MRDKFFDPGAWKKRPPGYLTSDLLSSIIGTTTPKGDADEIRVSANNVGVRWLPFALQQRTAEVRQLPQ